ncbi:MAG: helix-turn-helix transcriptional regulator [Candidatus Aminicenantes bacterium]|nr:helix-turn-helix transcriptional regulator [Candidatus Aminicenantes bacterium]
MKDLTPLEQMILGAIWSLENDAYGVSIKKRVADLSGRDLMYGTLYNVLSQLVRKELVGKSPGDPTPERGGRRKIYYRLTPEGRRAFREAFQVQRAFWSRLADLGKAVER